MSTANAGWLCEETEQEPLEGHAADGHQLFDGHHLVEDEHLRSH